MNGTHTNHGLNAFEMKHFPIRAIPRKQVRLVTKKQLITALVLAIIVLAAMAVDALHLTPERIGAEVANAEVIHQNDYYCNQIKEQGDHLLIERGNAITELCASWGVDL